MKQIFQRVVKKVYNERVVINNRKKIGIILGGIILTLLFLLAFNIPINQQIENKKIFGTQLASPTPFPFQEMTIPYLRNRTYESSLGERNKISENASYTSYLTSYTSDGLKINALLTIPNGEQPEKGYPAIVFIHGYIPPTLYKTLERYRDYVDYLASNGFVVLKIDLRGHGESEGEPGGGYFGSDYVIDTLNAYAALQSADFVNPKAIGLWGHSMAGNIIMRSIAAKPTISAVVIWAGAVYSYVDRDKYGINDNSYRPPSITNAMQNKRQQLIQRYGSPSAKSVFWRQVIPTNYLNDLKGAIQIDHAVDDDVVNIGYSRDLIQLFDKTKVPHELWEYPSGGHNISGASFLKAMEHTVEFFKRYLNREK